MISGFFQCHKHNVSEHGQQYLCGLLSSAERKNMERICEVIPGTKQTDLQHFLSDSPWDEEPIWKWVGLETARSLGGGLKNTLLIDESGFHKKGKSSVGVARQYNGRQGKVDNCQIGVFGTLSLDQRSGLVGSRLYLPREWVKNKKRCRAAGIPKEKQVFKTKIDLAWDLIESTHQAGVKFGQVGIDTLYGRDQNLLLKVAALGKVFMADVDCSQWVWLEEPAGTRRPMKIKASGAQRVDGLWKKGRGVARPVVLRTGENGPVEVKVWRRRVWIWPGDSEMAMELWLVVSERSDGTVKYSLSNADQEIGLEELAQQQGQRYFVERSFQDGKSHLGMGQYQARGWRSWHHHMALVGLAMHFTLLEREALKEEAPLLSVRDIVEFIGGWFASEMTHQDLRQRIADRHRRRTIQMQQKLRQAATKVAERKIPK